MFAAAAIVLSRISIFWQPRGGKYCTLMAAPCSQQRAEGQLACFEAGGNSRQRVQRLGTLAQPYRRIYRTVATPLRLGLLLSAEFEQQTRHRGSMTQWQGAAVEFFPRTEEALTGMLGKGTPEPSPSQTPTSAR